MPSRFLPVRTRAALTVSGLILPLALTAVRPAGAATASGSLVFSNTPLLLPDGSSEPAIAISSNGTMAVTGLHGFIPNVSPIATRLWLGPFGSVPVFQGLLDADLQKPGKQITGGHDADIDIGTTDTLHATTLLELINPTSNHEQFGVSAVACPNATSPSSFSLNGCTEEIIATTNSDRPWISSERLHVYISYHDPFTSSLIHVQRSDDDGFTWTKAGDPITGQGSATAAATFDNIQGPIVADPFTENVYTIYAASEPGPQKHTLNLNNIFASRSTDLGRTWTASLVYHAPLGTRLAEVFPSLAVDPTNGKLYAVWSDAHAVFFSTSSDHGSQWSPAVAVNIAPASTAVLPWVTAFNGTVDLVYYGTPAQSKDDPNAVWDTYLAQTTDDGMSFTQSKVSNRPNHVGVICTNGTTCTTGTRNLLDLFKVAIDPQNGLTAVAYADDTLTQDASGNPLPQVVLAQQ